MIFPTTGILEDGSGADEDPLDTHWDDTLSSMKGGPYKLGRGVSIWYNCFNNDSQT